MRLSTGVLLALLISPLAQAELIDDVNDRGELRIAVQSDTPPYAYKENEHLTGFEIELGQAIAKELDVRAQFVEAPADQLLPGVQSGKFDIALDQLDAKQTLDGQLDISQPYGADARVIPFQKDNPAFESAANNALQRIKDDGRLTALEQKWLKNQAASQ
ncbi:substrate-binding periplasmic protein [Pseudomonas guariconensis]|uniref:substrate-binding periplasmic protein n=1 Tax=Pseudomonas guariconensis TaxID=1288410 RepID=UPI002D1F731E|nr:transporter substrate-binding domain-containing protein [Pseudomonas guariconensis]MEB3843762.1 transporter substrate-binding domain-containing protein [Pseudomonas guariconensis]MEB3876630.1 transporter substrate-binding domain-containing protein [Pseudomonas guariconensis]MEB3880842.1 transporter substrate-binding domain-containing protein [Pseudomonas guariconensis]MEB3898266.1 transporter substrate-binding domain-containing protein [Pseudomonas guariconensis]